MLFSAQKRVPSSILVRLFAATKRNSSVELASSSNNSSNIRINSGKHSFPQLVAEVRSPLLAGSSKVRRLREAGKVPGVIYGVDEDQNVLKIMICVDSKLIMTEMRDKGKSLESTIYELHVDGQKHLVTPRQLQINPITEKPLSINFIKYWPGTRMRIPVEFINADQSVDLRRGSFLIRVNRFIECVCDMDIPKSLVLDLTGVQKGDVLKLQHVQFPPNVKPSRNVPPDFVVGVIKTTRGS